MTEFKSKSLAELNRERTTLKVKEALAKLRKSNLNINIKSVSEKAGISRKTIYNRLDLKLMIEEATMVQNDIKKSKSNGAIEKQSNASIQKQRIEKLRENNRQLIEDKKAILEQNMILTKENSTLKRRIYDLEELLQKNKGFNVIEINK